MSTAAEVALTLAPTWLAGGSSPNLLCLRRRFYLCRYEVVDGLFRSANCPYELTGQRWFIQVKDVTRYA